MQRPTARPDRGPNKKSLALILAACLIALPAPPPALAVVVETRTVEHIAAALPTQTTDNSRPVPPAARDYALGQADLATVPVFSGGAQESDPESDPDGQMYYKNQYKYQSPDSGSDLTIVESIIYLGSSEAQADAQYDGLQRRKTGETTVTPQSVGLGRPISSRPTGRFGLAGPPAESCSNTAMRWPW